MTPQADSSQFELRLRPCGGLVDRALERLAAGPVDTATLAAEVLALRGNPRAAAAAVFTLLGTDHRVEVDDAGVWSLAGTVSPAGSRPLGSQDWVVVDVETIGGSPASGRIIEIAAVQVGAGGIDATYSTLVNPGRPIPRMISSLTGIGNETVARAPTFDQIVPTLSAALSGRLFVGHNASFDWRFLCAEMERCAGRTLDGRRICTLRLARRIVPHLPSRSLGALAHYYGIEMAVHHRALDDAVATAHLLLRFLGDLEERGVTDWASLQAFFRRRVRRRRRTARPRSMDAA